MAALDRILETVALGESCCRRHPLTYPHMDSSWPRVNSEMLSSPSRFMLLNLFVEIKNVVLVFPSVT